jgi:SAM-dependent methyltransferase
MSKVDDVKYELYPECNAGGFSKVDGTIEFYTRVNSLLDKSMFVLNFGAGRGAAILDDPVSYRRTLQVLRGKVAEVIGIDIDDVVRSNPDLDKAIVVSPDEPLPLADGTIDLVISDATFEHIDNPAHVSREMARLVRPGGWICARTPNLIGYIGLGANLIPNARHVKLLRHLQPDRKEIDVFPTRYKMNTVWAIKKYFPDDQWRHFIYTWNAEPAYFGSSKIAWLIMKSVFKFAPGSLGSTLMIFMQKK